MRSFQAPRVGVGVLLWVLAGCGEDEQREQEPDAAQDAVLPDTGTAESDAAVEEDARAKPDVPDEHGEDERSGPFERLLVADAERAFVHVLDVEPDEIHRSFELQGVARVYSSGMRGYAVQGDANRVTVITSGLSFEDHDDHVHEERARAEREYELDGEYPVHFVAHDGVAALFFDDEGAVRLLDESTLSSEEPGVTEIVTPYPHHGVALAFHDHVLVSRPELLAGETRAAPTGIGVYTRDGAATSDVFGGCTRLHGEATHGERALFGCVEGVLVVEHTSGGFTGRVIVNPESDLEAPPRVGTLVANDALGHAIGNYGAQGVCTVDVERGVITSFDLGEPYVQFDLTPTGDALVVLTKTGELVLRDPNTLTERARFSVTSPVVDDANHGASAPQFALGAEHLYVTDPERAEVHVVDLGAQEVVRDITVPGKPAKLAVLRPRL